MTAAPEPVLFCWSGGKDSAMALHALCSHPEIRVAALLTTVTETYDRISMHGVRRELLYRQAESTGFVLQEVPHGRRAAPFSSAGRWPSRIR